MKAFADIADLPEDERIRLIAAQAESQIVGFFVEDDPKADRYIKKLEKYPIRFIDRKSFQLQTVTVIMVRVGPKES